MDADPAAAPDVELRAVTKRFGEVTAVDAVDLEVTSGEFLTLLGPSGCGKTTHAAHDRRLRGRRPRARSCIGGRHVRSACRRTAATSTRSSSSTRCSRT